MNSITRRWWLLAMAGAPIVVGLTAQSLVVRLENECLRVNAPNMEFLTDKPLERLKDGHTVGYSGQLTVSTCRANALPPSAEDAQDLEPSRGAGLVPGAAQNRPGRTGTRSA